MAGYKISTQKSIAFLYTNGKQSKKESGNNPIYNSLLKYVGINITKYVKDLYSKNFTTQLKKTEENWEWW